MSEMPNKPFWMRGYRVHGYWLGEIRLGWVGLPQGRGSVKTLGYGWAFDWSLKFNVEGRTETLRAAKKAVEAEYQKFLEKGNPPPVRNVVRW